MLVYNGMMSKLLPSVLALHIVMQMRSSLGVCGSQCSMRTPYEVWVVVSKVKNFLKLPLALPPINLYQSYFHIAIGL